MLEDRVHQAVDLLIKRLRGDIEGQLNALAEELLHLAREEQQAATLEARHAVENEAAAALEAALAGARAEARDAVAAELAAVRAEGETALAQARRDLERAAAAARQEAEAATQVRRNSEAALAQVRQDSERAVAKARQEAEAATEAQQNSEAALAQVRQDSERAVAKARQEAEAATEAQHRSEAALAQARADAASASARVHEAHEKATAAAAETAALRAELDAVARERVTRPATTAGTTLLDRLRALDGARSLSETLDVLADVAGAEAGRAAVLVVQGGRLRGWRFAGFGSDVGSARDLDLAPEQPGILSRVLQTGQVWSTRPDAAGRTSQAPSFARLQADRTGLALPVLVGGKVAGIVYADDAVDAAADDPGGPDPAADWRDALDTVVRYAGRCLEALTAQRTAQAMAAMRAPKGTGGATAEDEQGARRYARLLLSEIKVYNEAAVEAGRRQRDLLVRLGPEIERARRLFEARVPGSLAARHACFEDELIRTLAGGDASLLGREVAL